MNNHIAESDTQHYGGKLLATAEDAEGIAEVIDVAGLRALHFSSPAIQSLIDPISPETLQLPYTRAMALALMIQAAPRRVLLIGLGGGALLHFIFHHFPAIKIDVIERRPAVIQLAKEHFLLPDDSRIQIFCGDAMQLLAELTDGYDVIFNDAYSNNGPDISLYSDIIHQHSHRLIGDQGLLVSNLWQRRRKENIALITSLRRFFPAMAYHKDDEGRNCVLFTAGKAWPRKEFAMRAVQFSADFKQNHRELSYGVRSLSLKWEMIDWFNT